MHVFVYNPYHKLKCSFEEVCFFWQDRHTVLNSVFFLTKKHPLFSMITKSGGLGFFFCTRWECSWNWGLIRIFTYTYRSWGTRYSASRLVKELQLHHKHAWRKKKTCLSKHLSYTLNLFLLELIILDMTCYCT